MEYPWSERRLDHMAGTERMWTYKFRGKPYPYIASWLNEEWASISGRDGDYLSYKDGHIVYKIDWKNHGFPGDKDGSPRGMMEATGEMIGRLQRLVIDTLDKDLEKFREQCEPCDPESKKMIEEGSVLRIEHFPNTRGPNLKVWGLGWHYMDSHWQSVIDEYFYSVYRDEYQAEYRHKLADTLHVSG